MNKPADSPSQPSVFESPWIRILVVSAALLAIAIYGPRFLQSICPPPEQKLDFVQEWLSARNFWSGHSIYEHQNESILRHTGFPTDMSDIPWNAHPPGSVLIALPAGLFDDYRTAHFAWNLVTIPCWILSIALIARELRILWRMETVIGAIAITMSAGPVLVQVGQGQLNFVLLPVLVLGWMADRRGYSVAAGVCFGVAAGIKLFPLFLFVYLLFSGRFRALVTAIASAIGLNLIALGCFGIEAFQAYLNDVLPSLKTFRASWRNDSLAGFWYRVFGPDERATVAIAVSVLMVGVVVARKSLSARSRNPNESDRAIATAIIGMLLASPLLWIHGLVLMLLPLILLATRLEPLGQRCVFLLVLPAFWVTENFFVNLLFGGATASGWLNQHDVGASLAVNLFVLSLILYALLIMFGLTAFGRWRTLEES